MRFVRFALVLVVALELALAESFLVAARPFGTALPVSAVLAVVGNVVLGVVGARVLGRPLGAALPGLLWLAVALTLGSRRAEGDVVVTSTWRGISFLVAGAAAAAGVVAVTAAGKNGATPGGDSRR